MTLLTWDDVCKGIETLDFEILGVTSNEKF